MKTMLLQIVEDHVTQATESQLSLLKRVAAILRSVSLNFRQFEDTMFKGSVAVNNGNTPLELETFIQWLLTGTMAIDRNNDY